MKRTGYLIGALGLFALAAWLMLPSRAPRVRRAPIEFPHAARPHEIERGEQRRTLSLPATPVVPASPPASPAAEQARGLYDPLHVALPPARSAIVIEAGALLDSPAGRMLLNCLSPPQAQALRELEERTGLAPLEQIERIALAAGSPGTSIAVMSGDFSALDFAQLADGQAIERVGRRAQLAERQGDGFALWDNRMLLVGQPAAVRAAVRRLDGEDSVAPSSLEGEMYGDAYGSVSGATLSGMLPGELGERLRAAADRVLLHVDASDDLLLVAEVHGAEREALAELSRALAGAMAVARLKAVHDDDRLLADLLDESRVIPGDGSFQLEVALPLASIERALGDCARHDADAP